ncbi:MAG: beta-ketoacyl-ACP synthase II [Paludibacteraceae bacterium]|nr:beta-ketoacyl-ACP synthase II [Paludibacteraceae bacterium]
MELKRVVVTGLGSVNPLALNVEDTWKAIVDGKSGGAPITHFDTTDFKVKFACEVKGFDPNQYFDRKEGRKLDRYAQYAMVAAAEAIKNAGLDLDKEDKDEIGVIVAAGIGGMGTLEEDLGYYYQHQELGPKFSPFFIPKMISDIAAGQISIKYGFRGPNYSTASACASSTNALIDAFNLIRLGKANAIITGGAEAAITPSGVGGFVSMTALSTRNDSPETASRPFSASRDGFVMGEGSSILVFEELQHALDRGANILCEVVGGGLSADAYHITLPHPDGARLVMQRALADAGLQPQDVDYVNVHGTSTGAGDRSEAKAIQMVFGDHAYKLNISSTKSMTGHMLGAAGATEALICIETLLHGIVPPTINHQDGDNDEEIDYNLNFTFNKAQKRDVKVALSNTFGFGGHNASVIVKKFEN